MTRRNREHLPAIGAHLGELAAAGGAVHAWHLYRFLPVGRGGATNADDLGVTVPDFLTACAGAKALGLPFPVYRRDDMLRSSSVAFFWKEDGRLRVGSNV